MDVERMNFISPCMYAIICSKETKSSFTKVVDSLFTKYDTKWPGRVSLLEHLGDPGSILVALQNLRPSFCCFVASHQECSRKFISLLHHLTRDIDPSNPFYDTIWGVLTARNEEDFMFSVQQEDLIVRRVLAGTPVNLSNCESGVWYNEGVKGEANRKKLGCPSIVKEQCPDDSTEEIVNELSAQRNIEKDEGVDMVVTSGHASERDWNIGYSFKSGKLVSQGGSLCGRNLKGELMPVTHNGKAKIYSAAGNCLMGHVSDEDCMALSWMHSAGVVQMTGYTVVTWFGYAGWGVHSYFFDNPGEMTFSEAFFANHQSLQAKLHRKFPHHSSLPEDATIGEADEECRGLLHDQDKVAFYGDPAFEARLMSCKEDCSYLTSMNPIQDSSQTPSEGSLYKITVQTKCHGKFNCAVPSDEKMTFSRPPVHLFPCMMREVELVEGDVVLNCRSVLFPLYEEYKRGETHSVIIRCKI